MSSYIQNYGFTKTIIKDADHNFNNELKWVGDYDGNVANIKLDINDNDSRKLVSMQLNNNDIMKIFGIQPVDLPLEQRLSRDFLGKPIALEGALIKKKTRKHRRKRNYSP
jgi:hypothetical protein